MAEQGAVLGQAEKRETEKHEITINPASLKKKKKLVYSFLWLVLEHDLADISSDTSVVCIEMKLGTFSV